MSGRPDIRLLLSDVDGTLVTGDKRLTVAAKAAAGALQEAGIGFTITSSRPPRGLRMLIEPLALTLPIAGFNGGLMAAPDLSVIESHPIEPEAARRTVDFLHSKGVDVWVYDEEQWFVPDRLGPHVDREAWILNLEPQITRDFDAQLDRAFKIVGVSDDPQRMAAAEETAQDVLGPRVSATRSATYFLDVTNVNASKACVVTAMARRLGIEPAQIATIGDMPNDVLMFRQSGFSIAMGNASDAVKAQASAVTDSNEHEGFAKAIRELILGERGAAPLRHAGKAEEGRLQ
ncbi:MAG TPA: Cof-type HAD-IIB family hydrolase [Caulobacteraceae bacterium]|jgi:hypothetical protein|nr:Cof-type HAD-IIB family hydrolase [Caulobacteraceae bacterium]